MQLQQNKQAEMLYHTSHSHEKNAEFENYLAVLLELCLQWLKLFITVVMNYL